MKQAMSRDLTPCPLCVDLEPNFLCSLSYDAPPEWPWIVVDAECREVAACADEGAARAVAAAYDALLADPKTRLVIPCSRSHA